MVLRTVPLPAPEVEEDSTWDSTYQSLTQTSPAICGSAVSLDARIVGLNQHAWTHPVSQGAVHCLVDHAAGDLVAAATSSSLILLRHNGQVLATRSLEQIVTLQFVGDYLLVETTTTLYLVSNIQPSALNSDDPNVVAEAARTMQVGVVEMDCDFRAITATLYHDTLRFVVCRDDGSLAVFQYNSENKSAVIIPGDITVENATIDFDLGFRMITLLGKTFVGMHAVEDTSEESLLLWIDLETRQVVSRYATTDARITQLEPIESNDSTLAIVVAKKVSGRYSLQVLQYCVDETLGLMVFSEPRAVYEILLDEATRTVNVAAITGTPWAFRFWNDLILQEFWPDTTLAEIMENLTALLTRGSVREADALAETHRDLIQSDPFTAFHPSELALRKLLLALDEADASSAQDCLRTLTQNAIESDRGEKMFMSGVEAILRSDLTIDYFIAALSTVAVAMHTISDHKRSSHLSAKRDAILQKIDALNFLRTVDGDLPVPFRTIRSTRHLFAEFVQVGRFDLAVAVCRSNLSKQITKDALVKPILALDENVDPTSYSILLSNVVLPRLSTSDLRLPLLQDWACKLADALDRRDEAGLDSAVELLRRVDKGIQEIRRKVHSSFGCYSPFVDLPRAGHSRLGRACTSPDAVRTSGGRRNLQGDEERPIATILTFGALETGALLSRNQQVRNDDLGDEDCVAQKLFQARCLQAARGLGLVRGAILLYQFDSVGGASFVAQELVLRLVEGAESQGDFVETFQSQLHPFCSEFSVNEDEMFLRCAKNLCRGKNISEKALRDACFIGRGCASAKERCQCALVVLRAALLCGRSHSAITEISKDALQWAVFDSTVRAELEEASRLLKIDEIVRKYCGCGSRELFRVDNPRHCSSLLAFVTRQVVVQGVIQDATALCEAFHHLSLLEAWRKILRGALLYPDGSLVERLFREMVTLDGDVAAGAFIGMFSYTEQLLKECTSGSRTNYPVERRQQLYDRAEEAVGRCCCLIVLARNLSLSLQPKHFAEINHILDGMSLSSARESFAGIRRLQKDFKTFESISGTLNITRSQRHVASLLSRAVGEDSTAPLSAVKLICQVLSGPISSPALWESAVAKHMTTKLGSTLFGTQPLNLLNKLGLLSRSENAGRLLVSASLLICKLALEDGETFQQSAGMEKVTQALSILQDHAVRTCKCKKVLASIVQLMGTIEFVFQGCNAGDEGTGEIVERLRQALFNEAWQAQGQSEAKQSPSNLSQVTYTAPISNVTWYRGDGLLLPPRDCLVLLINFCRSLCFGRARVQSELYKMLQNRGAHGLALKSLVLFQCMTLSDPDFAYSNEEHQLVLFDDELEDTLVSLVQRSLGVSSSGILNAEVDSQLASCLLLTLGTKPAFSAYSASLPTAVKTGDFHRIQALTNVGKIVSSGENLVEASEISRFGWKRQGRFFSQCSDFASKSMWAKVLSGLDIGVDFIMFRGKDEEKDPSVSNRFYQESLVAPMLSKLSQIRSTTDVLRVALRYADACNIEHTAIIKQYIELALSDELKSGSAEVQGEPETVDEKAKSVRGVLSRLERDASVIVLRKQVVALEDSSSTGSNYELYSLVLQLYQECLVQILDSNSGVPISFEKEMEEELAVLDERLGVIAILSAYFQGDRLSTRPDYRKLFLKLPAKLGDRPEQRSICGVIGSKAPNCEVFDPLKPLETIFSMDAAAVAALAPIGPLLGLPQGFVHARALTTRFQGPSKFTSDLPSFENDVLPVLERIRSPHYRLELVKWCSKQYGSDDRERLACLELAYNYSIEASEELERRRRIEQDSQAMRLLQDKALDSVKDIAGTKEALADVFEIKNALENAPLHLSHLTNELIFQIDSMCDTSSMASPEELVDLLCTSGSKIAAESLINGRMPVAHFREFANRVRETCAAIAQQHSHLNVSGQARELAHRWLFFGDSNTSTKTSRSASTKPMPEQVDDSLDQDTIDFVMDLSTLQNSVEACSTRTDKGTPQERGPTIMLEEHSSVRPASEREVSEGAAARASLRAAFLLAVAGNPTSSSLATPENKENLRNARPKKKGLFASLEAKRALDNSSVVAMGAELLQIVFATKPTLQTTTDKSTSMTSVSTTERDVRSRTTATFAMRHRALRAAAILCPQEALEDVVRQQGYLKADRGEAECSLRDCAFGVFVAKEIEEMGLTIPHADLKQLCSMHFLSYARTLRRHARVGEGTGRSKGRLLQLLLEMSLVRCDELDLDFLTELVDEMIHAKLPRTILGSLYRLQELPSLVPQGSPKLSQLEAIIVKALSVICSSVLSELSSERVDSVENIAVDATHTIDRLNDLIDAFTPYVQLPKRTLEQTLKDARDLVQTQPIV